MTQPPLTVAECEQRFWTRYGAYLFGESRKPQTSDEWLNVGKQLRGLQHFDELAQRLENAIKAAPQPAQRPQARQKTGEEGAIYYDGEGRACCPIHERPLKEGRWGWYCSAKDDTKPNGYCNFKTKDV
jgi:hypothetical protein